MGARSRGSSRTQARHRDNACSPTWHERQPRSGRASILARTRSSASSAMVARGGTAGDGRRRRIRHPRLTASRRGFGPWRTPLHGPRAQEKQVAAYDAVYLSLALKARAPLATVDRLLAEAAASEGLLWSG